MMATYAPIFDTVTVSSAWNLAILFETTGYIAEAAALTRRLVCIMPTCFVQKSSRHATFRLVVGRMSNPLWTASICCEPPSSECLRFRHHKMLTCELQTFEPIETSGVKRWFSASGFKEP